MRAAYMFGAGDVRVETVPDPIISKPTDAIVRITRACVCGSDLAFETMDLVSERGLQMLVFSAAPGSPAADSLQLLANWAATAQSGTAIARISESDRERP